MGHGLAAQGVDLLARASHLAGKKQDIGGDGQGQGQDQNADPRRRAVASVRGPSPLIGYAALIAPQGALPDDSTTKARI